MSEQRDSAGFLYQIGDTLTHRGVPAAENGEAGFRLFVVERTYQECPGGIQRHYVCRVISTDGKKEQIHGECGQFNEVELRPLPNATDSEIPREFRPLAVNLGLAYLYALKEKERLVAQCNFDGAAAVCERTAKFWETLRTAAKELMGEAGK